MQERRDMHHRPGQAQILPTLPTKNVRQCWRVNVGMSMFNSGKNVTEPNRNSVCDTELRFGKKFNEKMNISSASLTLLPLENCIKQGNCTVNIDTRKNCQHCRLKKCVNVGKNLTEAENLSLNFNSVCDTELWFDLHQYSNYFKENQNDELEL
ncbi:hypothetical protein BpHYR1_003101 [Brachionus plicatilis]|uniref:Nuclear receptor domain-containing protein n=1 Tax=Brachionus plicatilis TaxID=10195 RepID=A0A3M7SJK4_BRAPC|nr:hypothetical protein BpHYR1_003101 [Brachionus plicatilis]